MSVSLRYPNGGLIFCSAEDENLSLPIFRRQFQDALRWYNARLAFTRTAATMSMVGFVLGLGDRHAENILIDTGTGDVMHVDFNILFNKGEFLRVPEVLIYFCLWLLKSRLLKLL